MENNKWKRRKKQGVLKGNAGKNGETSKETPEKTGNTIRKRQEKNSNGQKKTVKGNGKPQCNSNRTPKRNAKRNPYTFSFYISQITKYKVMTIIKHKKLQSGYTTIKTIFHKFLYNQRFKLFLTTRF